MTKFPYVQASPRGEEPKSTQAAEAYLAVLRKANPDLEVDALSVWDTDHLVFDGNKVAAKVNVMAGQGPTGRYHRHRRDPLPANAADAGPNQRLRTGRTDSD